MTGQNDAISVGIDSSVRAPDNHIAALQVTISKIINTGMTFKNIKINTNGWLVPF